MSDSDSSQAGGGPGPGRPGATGQHASAQRARSQPANASGRTVPGQPAAGWGSARREIVVACCLTGVLAACGYAIGGLTAMAAVVAVCAIASLVVLRWLVWSGPELPAPADPGQAGPLRSFSGFWRLQGELSAASRSLAHWERGPRQRLRNLLAARLAERHGVSLRHDPETARRLLAGQSGRDDLWPWIGPPDPDWPPRPDAADQPGIPPRTLAALIDRLERL